MTNKLGSTKIIIFTVSIILIGATALLQLKTNTPSDTKVLEQVKSALTKDDIEVSDSLLDIWWISNDGYSITNDESPAVEAKYFDCESDNSAQREIWSSNALEQSSAVDEVMQRAGFTVNDKNTSDSLTDDQFVDYVRAYERENTKAVLVINTDCWSDDGSGNSPLYYSSSFSMTDDFDTNYESQSPYLIDLNLKDVVIHVSNVVDDWALINVNYRRSGHYVIAEKANGKWVERFGGQDLVPCTLRDELKIPIELVPECWAETS
jgi:hypothetical protein